MKAPLQLGGLVLALVFHITPVRAGDVVVTSSSSAGEPGKFAAEEIRREAKRQAASVRADQYQTRVLLLVQKDGTGAEQNYTIRVGYSEGVRNITVTGGTEVGAMYGGLDVAEAVRTGRLDQLRDSDHKPHIEQRGIKFNIPLDLRTPSYTDPCDASQANIPEVWSIDFWQEMFDDMARHRYNLISLWSLNPFPSIVKVPEFPNVALDDVWRTKEKLDASFGPSGDDFVRPKMLANHEVVKKISIDDKIKFWRAVMQLAKDRGISVYWFTWNTFLFGVEGKDEITANKTAPRTIEYFRAAVRETIKTYPLLAGFGITAGEEMKPNDFKDMTKDCTFRDFMTLTRPS